MNVAKENADEDFVSASHFDIHDVARWFGVAPDDPALLSDIARATALRERIEQQHAETLRIVQTWAEQYFNLPSREE